MNTPAKKTFRKRHLFPRSLQEVVNAATKPLMDKQGKLYSALLRDWAQIVGPERSAITRPERLQFSSDPTRSTTLHLHVRPAAAPELTYALEQMLEQCARYFGYRAIERIILHPAHGMFDAADTETPHTAPPVTTSANIFAGRAIPDEMRNTLERIATHLSRKP